MKYFIYTRKSTDSEERQVLSIESQISELKEFAAKEKLEILASFCEAQTAKEPEKYRLKPYFDYECHQRISKIEYVEGCNFKKVARW